MYGSAGYQPSALNRTVEVPFSKAGPRFTGAMALDRAVGVCLAGDDQNASDLRSNLGTRVREIESLVPELCLAPHCRRGPPGLSLICLFNGCFPD